MVCSPLRGVDLDYRIYDLGLPIASGAEKRPIGKPGQYSLIPMRACA